MTEVNTCRGVGVIGCGGLLCRSEASISRDGLQVELPISMSPRPFVRLWTGPARLATRKVKVKIRPGTHVVGLQVGGNFCFGAVTVAEQLFLVVQEFLAGLGRVLGVLGYLSVLSWISDQ